MKTFFLGLLVGILMLAANFLFGFVAGQIAPSIQAEYQNQSVFRPWSDPRMWLMWLQPLITGVLLTWIWSGIWTAIPGETFMMKGIAFALTWFLLCIPGMIISYSSFQVSGTLVMSWTIGNLFQAFVPGYVLGKIYAKQSRLEHESQASSKTT